MKEKLFEPLFEEIKACVHKKGTCLVCIDGRAGAGKTTLASLLSKKFDARVFHMDDYFSRDGSDLIDFERFKLEITKPVLLHEKVCFQAWDCASKTLREPIIVPFRPITVIEGAFCLHEKAGLNPDLRVFLTADEAARLSRIERRGGNREAFLAKWMPREEVYIREYGLPREGDLVFFN